MSIDTLDMVRDTEYARFLALVEYAPGEVPAEDVPAEVASATESIAQDAPGSQASTRPEGQGRPTILVVEDDESFRHMLIAALEVRFESRVLHAGDGVNAITAILRERPQIILMDLAMPKMDGLATTRMLKRNPLTRHIPIIAFTSYGRLATWQRQAKEAGCDHCLDKSIRLDELYEAIESLLQKS